MKIKFKEEKISEILNYIKNYSPNKHFTNEDNEIIDKLKNKINNLEKKTKKENNYFTETNSNIKFVYIKGGDFKINRHKIVSLKSFWISESEVSQEQFKNILKTNPSKFIGNMKPVESINYFEIKEFLNKLNQSQK